MSMKLSFRRKSIKKFPGAFPALFARPFVLKFFLLFIILGSTVYFKLWAERQEPYSLPSPASFARKPASEPVSPSLPTVVAPPKDFPPDSINVNMASYRELEALPGIGPRLAAEIVGDRLRNGPFNRADDLLRVKGIGPKKLHKIESYLRFRG